MMKGCTGRRILRKAGRRRPGPGEARVVRVFAGEDGISLVVVMWVLAILMLAGTAFAYAMRVESFGTRNFADRTGAYYLAVSGVNAAAARIKRGYDLVYLDGDGKVVFASRGADGVTPLWTGAEGFALASGTIRFTVGDESGKVNLNKSARETIYGLLAAAGVELAERDVVADSIIDWTDENHEFHVNGAEDDHYMGLPVPYQAKDGPFDTVEDLLLVKGVTPEVFHGDGYDAPGIGRYLTVKGDGRVNINTAPEPVLEAAYGKGRAMEIILHRSLEGYYTAPVYGGGVTSRAFSVISTGESNGVRVSVRALLDFDPGSGAVKVTHWSEIPPVAPKEKGL